jgi:hypothetical protein
MQMNCGYLDDLLLDLRLAPSSSSIRAQEEMISN